MPYTEDDMLMLSGIQHYAFCPRQWALIHIEQQWSENLLTVEGKIMHQHVDDPFYRQKMGDHICLRAVSLASKELGLYGVSDIVELHPSEGDADYIMHPNYPGRWIPFPVEYKHGKPKNDEIDIVQLVAQAMCLEEEYGIHIPKGAIYYGATRRRLDVEITDKMRDLVKTYAQNMHDLFQSAKTPSAKKKSYCSSCSLKDICMPDSAYKKSASNYLRRYFYEETT